jgi:hypothetical protein
MKGITQVLRMILKKVALLTPRTLRTRRKKRRRAQLRLIRHSICHNWMKSLSRS